VGASRDPDFSEYFAAHAADAYARRILPVRSSRVA
jgi:hypothetical protein